MRKWPKKVQFSQSKMIQHIFNRDQRLYKAAIFLCIAGVSISSCKKVESDLGLDELPGDQLHTLVDTIEVNSYSVAEDSLRTDELSNNMIGSYKEPVFGTTTASIYAEVRSTATTITFGNTPVVDSVVFSMKLTGHYGFETSQTFHVYKLTEDIYRDSAYFSNTTKTNDGIDLVKAGFNTFTPSLTAEPVIDGDTLDPQIRIRLDETFGSNLIADSTYLTGDSLNLILKGFFITVDAATADNTGSIYSVELEDPQSNVTVYFHNTTDTSSFQFRINDKSARFTHYAHDYTNSEVFPQLSDSTLGNEFYYLQAGHGVVANLFFPNIFDLQSEGPVVVNKAELYLPVQYYSIDPLSPPTRLIAFGLKDDGEIYTMPDFTYPGSSVFGGGYDEDLKAYKFNILRYVQDVLRGDLVNNPIRITPTSSSISVNRVIMSGKNSPNREKPYLKIYYTKF